MQRQKIFFFSLVLLSLLSAGYFTVRTANAFFDFFQLKENAPARILRWEIKETNGKFPLKAYYSFDANGSVWHGTTQLAAPWHLNEAAAIASLQERAQQNWAVWFNPKNPSKSSLEKEFPTGFLIRTLVCYGVIVYFILVFRRLVKTNLHIRSS